MRLAAVAFADGPVVRQPTGLQHWSAMQPGRLHREASVRRRSSGNPGHGLGTPSRASDARIGTIVGCDRGCPRCSHESKCATTPLRSAQACAPVVPTRASVRRSRSAALKRAHPWFPPERVCGDAAPQRSSVRTRGSHQSKCATTPLRSAPTRMGPDPLPLLRCGATLYPHAEHHHNQVDDDPPRGTGDRGQSASVQSCGES